MQTPKLSFIHCFQEIMKRLLILRESQHISWPGRLLFGALWGICAGAGLLKSAQSLIKSSWNVIRSHSIAPCFMLPGARHWDLGAEEITLFNWAQEPVLLPIPSCWPPELCVTSRRAQPLSGGLPPDSVCVRTRAHACVHTPPPHVCCMTKSTFQTC